MRTLYLRNVPDEVAARLEELAARAGISLNALAVRELSAVARRAENAALLETLPDRGVNAADVLRALREERAGRP